MDKKIFVIIAAVCMMLAGCGDKKDTASTGNSGKVAGGAVTKVTTQDEDTAVTEAEEDSKAEADDAVEQGPQGADSYENSFTAALIKQLGERNFSMTFAVNDIDNGEGMELKYEETFEVKDSNGHQTIKNADGTVSEIYTVDGASYQANAESGKMETVGIGNTMSVEQICSMVLGFSPMESEYLGAESFSDGTVQEKFMDETNNTFVCVYADNSLTACEGGGLLRDYKGYTAGNVAEIKLPEGN